MITLATLEHATEQEVFDQVARHMLKQRARSWLQDDVCAYRGADGLKCAAGCLISDEEAEQLNLAAGNINTLPWGCLISRGVAPDKHRSLISALQHIHDSPNNVPEEDWEDHLKALANQRGLSYKVFKETHGK
jgi:hypothetical protein